jgi:hypothetical protein
MTKDKLHLVSEALTAGEWQVRDELRRVYTKYLNLIELGHVLFRPH